MEVTFKLYLDYAARYSSKNWLTGDLEGKEGKMGVSEAVENTPFYALRPILNLQSIFQNTWYILIISCNSLTNVFAETRENRADWYASDSKPQSCERARNSLDTNRLRGIHERWQGLLAESWRFQQRTKVVGKVGGFWDFVSWWQHGFITLSIL